MLTKSCSVGAPGIRPPPPSSSFAFFDDVSPMSRRWRFDISSVSHYSPTSINDFFKTHTNTQVPRMWKYKILCLHLNLLEPTKENLYLYKIKPGYLGEIINLFSRKDVHVNACKIVNIHGFC